MRQPSNIRSNNLVLLLLVPDKVFVMAMVWHQVFWVLAHVLVLVATVVRAVNQFQINGAFFLAGHQDL